MEKYLEEGSLSEEDLASGLRKGVLNASLVPVVVGSSLENKGGRELLDAIARLFPSPLERPAFLDADGNERASSDEGPACGFVFKTIADPFSGQLNMVRVISGTISSESTLKNMRTCLLYTSSPDEKDKALPSEAHCVSGPRTVGQCPPDSSAP